MKSASSTIIAAEGRIMLPENRIPTHPGEILQEQFLEPLGLTQVALADHLGVPVQQINEIVRGKRGVTPETAWLLAQAFDTTPEFWINLQTNHDLTVNRGDGAKVAVLLERLQTPAARDGLEAAFHASPEELGRAAVEAAALRE
jgi:addiction module HigA family antidote